jgi:hypothetical protein
VSGVVVLIDAESKLAPGSSVQYVNKKLNGIIIILLMI